MITKSIKVELSSSDLVTLLADATYRSYDIEVYLDEQFKNDLKGDCLEDTWVYVLQNGGYLTVIDLNSSESVAKWKPKKSSKAVGIEHYDDEDYGCLVYHLTLNDILKAVQTERGYSLMKELLSGRGDYYTAYNIIQIALFKEEIYG